MIMMMSIMMIIARVSVVIGIMSIATLIIRVIIRITIESKVISIPHLWLHTSII